MCTNGSGTNSVKPPVSFWRARVRTRWRAQLPGCSMAPNMIVTFDRRPTEWAVRWASSHSSVVILSGQRSGAHRVVEDLGGGARQRLETGVHQAAQVVRQRLVQPRGALGDLEGGEPVDVDLGHRACTARATSM